MEKSRDMEQFALLMATLAETFGAEAPNERKVEIYFRVLGDLTIEDLERAVLGLLNTRTVRGTFPVPAEIREAAGGGEAAAVLALDKATKAAEWHGAYSSVIFDDPVIHMTIDAMGGWPKFCRPDAFGDNEEGHWKDKQFRALYETFAKHPRAECPKVLVGLNDTSYQSGNETIIVSPKIVGNRERALAWTGKEQKRLESSPASTVEGLVTAIAGTFRMGR